jgi:hypothetical protein
VGWALTALVATAASLVPQPARALPRDLAGYLFGGNMVRAETVHKAGGVLYDYRIDRGRILRKSAGSLVLLERDGTTVTVPVAANARIQIGGALVDFTALQRGLRATTVRNGDAPADLVLVRAPLPSSFLGPNMVRAEAVLKVNGTMFDYRVDRGRIQRKVAGGSLVLLERDGVSVTVPIAPTARIELSGAPVPLQTLRRGMTVTTVRNGDAPAELVFAKGGR